MKAVKEMEKLAPSQPMTYAQLKAGEESQPIVFGTILALAAGILGGLIFAPSHFVATQYANASFCLGISTTFAVMCTGAVIVCAMKDSCTPEPAPYSTDV